jgi:hypothetical protein
MRTSSRRIIAAATAWRRYSAPGSLAVSPATAAAKPAPAQAAAGGPWFQLTRESLALNATTSGTTVLQQSSGDTLWNVS